jgi:hypothetical protein
VRSWLIEHEELPDQPLVTQVPVSVRIEANYPVSVITDGMGLNITVMSYSGHLDFGTVADREQMRDVWKLIGWLRESLEELMPAAAGRQAPRDEPTPAAAEEAGRPAT